MPTTGQLWWAGEGDPADARIVFVNSDGTNQTVEADNDPAPELVTGFVQDVGLDTAAGFFFALINNGNLGTGARLVRGQIGGSGPATVVADFRGADLFDEFDDIIVNALHVDNINEKIYVTYQDPFGDAANTGIRQFGYDPLTGAVVDEGFLVRADLEGDKEIDPDNFGLDLLNVRDFELDLSSNTLYFTELFTGGLQEQGIYRMDLTTKVITQMVSSLQFPDEGTNGFIIDVEVDPTTDLVYFTTQSQAPFGSPGYNPAHNAVWYVNQGADNAVAVQLTLVGLPVGNMLYSGDMVFDHDQRRLYLESEEDGSTSADDVIYVFQLDATGTVATLVDTISPDPAFSGSGANIQGMAFNALPYLDDVNGNPAAAAEQGAAIDLLTGAPTISDVDGDHLASATVQISGGTFPGSDASDNLGVGAGFQQAGLVAGTNITVSWNQAASTLTLTGYDTLDNYEAVLAMVRYQATGDNPTNFGANPTRTVTWTVSDGALGIPAGSQNSQTSILAIAAEDDAPVNTTGGPVATSEDAASVAVTGLSVSDADSASLTVTLSVGRGTLAVASVPGGAAVSGSGTGSVQLSGTQAEINTTLAAANGVTYTPTPNVNGPDTLTMTSDDGTDQDVDMVAIGVAAVNDAPTVAGDGTEDADPIEEDTPSATGQIVADLFGGQYSDATDQVAGGSSADAFAGVAVTANGSSGAAGQWQYHNGVTWVDIGPASDGAAVLLDAGTSIRFNPAPGFTGAAPTLTVHLVDASAGAIVSGTTADLTVTGDTTPYSTGTVVLGQEVLEGNSPPTGVSGTLEVEEFPDNGTVVGTVVASDPDSSVFTYALVDDAGGRFDIDSSTGVVTVQDGLLIDYEQQASHTIRVEVTDDQGASAEFDMVVGVEDVHGELESGDGRDNVMYGGAETDIFFGGQGSDTILGQGGADFIFGGSGLFDPFDEGDFLHGGAGNDVIDGNGGDDMIYGGADGDVLIGGLGDDHLYGEGGNDVLLGGAGADRLDGGAGADSLTGGAGFDVFVFRKGEANGDVIWDFDGNGAAAGDTIRLEGYAAGTTFARIGFSDVWRINDHGSIEFVTIHADGNVHAMDYGFFP